MSEEQKQQTEVPEQEVQEQKEQSEQNQQQQGDEQKKEKKSKKSKKEPAQKPFTYDFKEEIEKLDRSALSQRLNVPRDWAIPKELLVKPKPQFVVGNQLRIDTILSKPEQFYDKNALVSGWLKAQRGGGVFLEINDGSRLKGLQVVVDKSIPNFDQISACSKDSCLRIYGKLIKSQGQGQDIEMQVNDPSHRVEVLGTQNDVAYPFPYEKKDVLHTSKQQMRDHAHLRIRTKLMGAIMRIRNNLIYSTHLFFQNNGFVNVHTPLITASDCEGAGEMFQVTTMLSDKGKHTPLDKVPINKETNTLDYTKDFFSKPTYLTVSGQLAVENYACALTSVYTFSPTFRAETSNSTRHLAEFWMIEPELAFADNIDNMDCAEAYVKFCIEFVLANNAEDLEFLTDYNLKEFEKQEKEAAKLDKSKKKLPAISPVPLLDYLKSLISVQYERITYTDAITILQKAVAEGKIFEEDPNPKWEVGLATEHEKFLCDYVFKKPVMVYNYPKEIKSFYMKLNPDQKTVACVDMLVPQIGELIGGSQREEKLDILEQKMEECGLKKEDYWWYLELRKSGTVPHSGFGLGFERLVMMCTGCLNIKDVIPFPRQTGYAEF